MERSKPNLIITNRDYQRLAALIEWNDSDDVELLWEELVRAKVVQQNEVPPDVVTMNSVICVRDEENGKERELKLVYPYQNNSSEAKVSILAPVGMALLGLKVNQEIEWPVPNGKNRKLKVVGIRYQPESQGEFAL